MVILNPTAEFARHAASLDLERLGMFAGRLYKKTAYLPFRPEMIEEIVLPFKEALYTITTDSVIEFYSGEIRERHPVYGVAYCTKCPRSQGKSKDFVFAFEAGPAFHIMRESRILPVFSITDSASNNFK